MKAEFDRMKVSEMDTPPTQEKRIVTNVKV
jgi:hypothetical protein